MIVHDAQQWKYVHCPWRLSRRCERATPLRFPTTFISILSIRLGGAARSARGLAIVA